MRWLQCAPPRPAIPRRRILVVPLLIKNPTSAGEYHETTPEPVLGAMTRSRSRRIAALAAMAPSLPEEILVWEIFVRLPAKDILRCRAVCRAWRGLTFASDFLLAHHRRQPLLPLLTLYGADSKEGRLSTFERGRPVLGFVDYDHFKIHASCDGLLLLSLFGPRFSICNPATRQCAPIPCLDSYYIRIAALYLHCPSGEYRILYWKDREQSHLKAAYYILMVEQGSSPRCIGVPSDIPGSEKILSTFHESTNTITFAPPIMLNNCLHWDTGYFRNNADIFVFDTVVESFRFMRSPAGATRFCTRLCDMEGSMGFSCFDDGRTIAKIWVLEDYEREVWSFKYHINLPVESLCNLQYTRHLVMSHNGDVLVYSRVEGYMFHYDNNGKLLEEFKCGQWDFSIIGHWFKESLVKHTFFPRQGSACVGQPSLFHRL